MEEAVQRSVLNIYMVMCVFTALFYDTVKIKLQLLLKL